MKYIILSLLLIGNCHAADNIFDYNFNLDGVAQTQHEEVQLPSPDVILPTITADKKAGTISVYFPETGKTEIGYALYGKQIGDVLDLSTMDIPTKTHPAITPAGTYKITRVFSWRLNQEILAFIQGTDKIMAIHAVWMGNPNQHRVQRLLSPTPSDNRITNGCINVDPNFFLDVLSKVPNGTPLIILPEK